MTAVNAPLGKKRKSIFLSEIFMGILCIIVVLSSLVSLIFRIMEQDSFEIFGLTVKLVVTVALFLSFKYYKWDVAKGLMGGVLFCLMYQEAHLVLARLWSEQDFDVYLIAGMQGSLFLAGAGMNLLMTVVITINHFFITYSSHGSPKNVILSRIALVFKFAVYLLLVIANSQLNISNSLQWNNSLQYLTDRALLLMLICVESQFDSFNQLRHEMLLAKRAGKESR